MKNLTYHQRIQLEVAYAAKISVKGIAHLLEVATSTVYREIKRNSMPEGRYIAEYAQKLSIARKKLAGSTEKKSFIFHYKRKKYVLYADRRKIRWYSDAHRNDYIFSPYYKMRRMGPRKVYNKYYGFIVYHFMDNKPLYEFLYAHLQLKRKVRKARLLLKSTFQKFIFINPQTATISLPTTKAA
ncbi:helix-turn-helix domain-containing protein [Flammeovirga pectinis]|nr:helix-turn-helix domain-containing protein [Flammeovirga pectinis]